MNETLHWDTSIVNAQPFRPLNREKDFTRVSNFIYLTEVIPLLYLSLFLSLSLSVSLSVSL